MSYPLLSALLSDPHIAPMSSSSCDTQPSHMSSSDVHSRPIPSDPFFSPREATLRPDATFRPSMPHAHPPRPVMVVRPRKFLPPPGQFLATKRLKHNNDVYYQTLYQYNELLKAHEQYLDSLLLTTAFKNLTVQTSHLSNSSTHRNPFKFRKILPKTSVLKPYKIEFNQPLSVPVVPKYLPPAPATPLLQSNTSDISDDCDNNKIDLHICT